MPINKAEETTVAFEQSKADLANKLREIDPNLGPGVALVQAGVAQENFGDYARDSEDRFVARGSNLPKPEIPVTFVDTGFNFDTPPDIIITVPRDVDPDVPGATGGAGTQPAVEPGTAVDIGAIVGDGISAIGSGIGNVATGIGEFLGGVGEGIGNGIGYGVDAVTGIFDGPPRPKPPVEDLGLTTEEIDAGRPAVERPEPVDQPQIIEPIDDLDAQEGVGPGNLGDLDDDLATPILKAAQSQAAIRERLNTNPEDWRVKLRLAPEATYLYKDPSIQSPADSILWYLRSENGVIFPYTPKIDITYRSEYTPYDPTHANHRYYFYKGSRIESVLITADFTAQDTREANYLLAVIHFFRSAGKMFYGQDAERGAPPPLVYLSGLGQYQFANNPCVITQFNYMLPDDVDYIRADTAQIRGSLQERRALGVPAVSLSSIWARLNGSGLIPGATNVYQIGGPSLTQGQSPTYVPTKITISLELLPIQSRKQISSEFSLKNYANGSLLRKGFW
jgi:hypothetical protein